MFLIEGLARGEEEEDVDAVDASLSNKVDFVGKKTSPDLTGARFGELEFGFDEGEGGARLSPVTVAVVDNPKRRM